MPVVAGRLVSMVTCQNLRSHNLLSQNLLSQNLLSQNLLSQNLLGQNHLRQNLGQNLLNYFYAKTHGPN